jgi:hypothetical protein
MRELKIRGKGLINITNRNPSSFMHRQNIKLRMPNSDSSLWGNPCAFPGYVADSGSLALIGAAAVLKGMARMTIAGTVIALEACGNITYLLPLMVSFADSRYAGNAINESMYNMQIRIKEMPFLEASLYSLGRLNYYPVSQIMAQPEVDKVTWIMEVPASTNHTDFPGISREGELRGFWGRLYAAY